MVDLKIQGLTLDDNAISHMVEGWAHAKPPPNSLHFNKNGITPEGIKRMAAGLKHLPRLESIIIENNDIGDDGAVALMDGLKDNHNLREISIVDCGLQKRGVSTVLQSVAQHPQIYSFSLSGEASDEVFPDAMALTQRKPGLAFFSIANIGLSVEAQGAISQAFIDSGNPNLSAARLDPRIEEGPHIHGWAAFNQGLIRHSLNAVDNLPQGERLSADELRDMDRRENGLRYVMGDEWWREKEKLHLADLPGLPARGDGFIDALYASDDKGYAPLDNPRLWRGNEDVMQALIDHPSFTPALLAKPTQAGGTLLESLANMADAFPFVERLNEKGVQLGAEQLLSANRSKPSALLANLSDQGLEVVSTLFTTRNWVGKPAQEITTTLRGLPFHRRDRIGNCDVLRLNVTRAQHHTAGAGR